MYTHATLAVRRLKPGSYDDWRQAWPPESFPADAEKAFILRNVEDPDEVIAFVFFDTDLAFLRADRAGEEHFRRYERMAPYVESIDTDGAYEVVEQLSLSTPSAAPAELIDLSGKTAIVTGAAKGIGLGIAARLHEAGARVTIADLDRAEAERVVTELNQARSDSALAVETDVSQPDSVAELVEKTVQQLGEPDILVNNAGIFPVVPFVDVDLPTFQRVFDVNVSGLFLVSQAVARRMIDRGEGGRIINVTSINALQASMVGFSHYDASKHAVWGFTQNIALELAPHGICVNAIAPGAIATPGVLERVPGDTLDDFVAGIPLGRIGESDDIGRVALFLASDLAGYMTGSHVVVDGGRLLA